MDEGSGQYYHHAYLEVQPDLNWRNPQVRAAMHEAMRFWLKRGVDGFRVDVIWHLIKNSAFRDNPPNTAWTPNDPEIERLLQVHSADQPEVHEVIAGMRRVLDEFENRLLIGEIYLSLERLVAYYGENLMGAHLPFNFQLLNTAWTAPAIGELVEKYEAALPDGGWPNWVLSNHDRPRIAARVGPDQARVAAMLLLTLRGTPTLYYGDELGIANVEIPARTHSRPWAKREPGLGVGRDPARTPMQWDGGLFAGFSTHEPWLPLTPEHETRNVATMSGDDASILSLVRNLLHYRRGHASLSEGAWRPLSRDKSVLAYERRGDDDQTLVVLNFTDSPRVWSVPASTDFRVAISTHGDRCVEAVEATLNLRGNEGLLLAPA